MKNFNIFPYILIFFSTFLILQMFQPADPGELPEEGTIIIEMLKDEYAVGKDIRVEVQNYSKDAITISDQCPLAPFNVMKWSSEAYKKVESAVEQNCENAEGIVIPGGETETISLLEHSYSLFGEVGRYKLETQINGKTYSTPEFSIKSPSFITSAWRTFVYNPIYNALVALIIYIPGHLLWVSIVILTIIIRTILLGPSIKAIRAQKRMQEIQPKLEALKKKHGDDQQRVAQETMLLWKSHKVNPLSSCLPLFIQFPILIALFYVVSGGLSPDRTVLLYNFLPDFTLSDINPAFFSFNLFEKSLFVFPIAIGSLQFLQMSLMTGMRKVKGSKALPDEIQTANKMMKYIMPLMIAVFSSQLPAAVGFYWGTSTFYGIMQQLVVNKEGAKDSTATLEDDVKVKVITKKKK